MKTTQGKLILVADDESDVRELVVFRLEHAGYEVITAADGEEAVELALARRPDLCVVDVMMPKLDGFEVTRAGARGARASARRGSCCSRRACTNRRSSVGSRRVQTTTSQSRFRLRSSLPGARRPSAPPSSTTLSPPMSDERKIRVVVAKPGLDGHDRGAKIIARALRDAGMEVIYTGLHQTPEQIAATVIQEDADAVGLSILSGAHMTLVPRIVELLKEQEAEEVVLTVGGTIPAEDIAELKELGVAEVFTPGLLDRRDRRVHRGRRRQRA